MDTEKFIAAVKQIRDHFADGTQQESTDELRDALYEVLATASSPMEILEALDTDIDGTPAYTIIFGSGDKGLIDCVFTHMTKFIGPYSPQFLEKFAQQGPLYSAALKANKKTGVSQQAQQMDAYVNGATSSTSLSLADLQQLSKTYQNREAPTTTTKKSTHGLRGRRTLDRPASTGTAASKRVSAIPDPETHRTPSDTPVPAHKTKGKEEEIPSSYWQQKWTALKNHFDREGILYRYWVFALTTLFVFFLCVIPGFAPAFFAALGVSALFSSKFILFIIGLLHSTFFDVLSGLILSALTSFIVGIAMANLDSILACTVWLVGMALKLTFSFVSMVVGGISAFTSLIIGLPTLLCDYKPFQYFFMALMALASIPTYITLFCLNIGEGVRQLAWIIFIKWENRKPLENTQSQEQEQSLPLNPLAYYRNLIKMSPDPKPKDLLSMQVKVCVNAAGKLKETCTPTQNPSNLGYHHFRR